MSEENIEIVRRGVEAFNRGDVDAFAFYDADFAPDFEYIPSGAVPGGADVARGPGGYKRFVRWLWDEFDDAHLEIHELIEAGDHVVASYVIEGRGKQSGAAASWHIWQVWTLRDGKVVRGQGFVAREEALEAAGLEE